MHHTVMTVKYTITLRGISLVVSEKSQTVSTKGVCCMVICGTITTRNWFFVRVKAHSHEINLFYEGDINTT